jgi:ketosteroid isomerase-like protein
MTASLWCALALFGSVLFAPADAPVPPALAVMAQTERDFAAACRKVGMRDSFLQYFADEALFFVPQPVNAKEALSKRPAEPFAARQLTWEPRLGDVASSADLGWLTGPSELVVPSAPQPGPRHQVYLSVWRRQPSGDWRVILDVGVATPSAASFDPGFQRFRMPDRYSGPGGKTAGTASLEAADRALNERAAKSPADGFAPALLDSSRLHRDEILPLVGKAAIGEWLRKQTGQFSASTTKAEAAEAGDFGYTYGSFRIDGEEPKTGSYIRMWERRSDGTWFVAVDIN